MPKVFRIPRPNIVPIWKRALKSSRISQAVPPTKITPPSKLPPPSKLVAPEPDFPWLPPRPTKFREQPDVPRVKINPSDGRPFIIPARSNPAFERAFDDMLNPRETIGDVIFEKIDKFVDTCETLVVSTGIPRLLNKVEQKSWEALSGTFGKTKAQQLEAEEKDPQRLRYWMKRYDEKQKLLKEKGIED